VDVLVTDHPGSGATVVTPVGQLDIDSGPRLHTTFDRLRASSIARVVVDLGELTYCDSTGLSALALARDYCTDAGGYLRLAVLSPCVLQLLTAVGIARTVPMYRSVSAACAGDLDGLVAAPRPEDQPFRRARAGRPTHQPGRFGRPVDGGRRRQSRGPAAGQFSSATAPPDTATPGAALVGPGAMISDPSLT
jgi:anti-anti-sigma factor